MKRKMGCEADSKFVGKPYFGKNYAEMGFKCFFAFNTQKGVKRVAFKPFSIV
ncbi:MAG: hypothetical protein N3F05_01700 [Candidatus Diapherotrites archaeon]|nr:hypothetical protein [Candidatus Diapherotrites archaeon]